MNIQPTYVTFEQAKLLKEKGFDVECIMRYNELEELTATKLGMHGNPNNYSDSYSAPEQWQVVEWLRVEKGIWVYVAKGKASDNYGYRIQDINGDKSCYEVNFKRTTPQEAYSEAFDYVLKELI